MDLCVDEKWKLSKKGSRNSCSGAAAGSSSRRAGEAIFRKEAAPSRKGCAFSRRCASLVKEQRARFYIMRRCVTMLICWREYRDC